MNDLVSVYIAKSDVPLVLRFIGEKLRGKAEYWFSETPGKIDMNQAYEDLIIAGTLADIAHQLLCPPPESLDSDKT